MTESLSIKVFLFILCYQLFFPLSGWGIISKTSYNYDKNGNPLVTSLNNRKKEYFFYNSRNRLISLRDDIKIKANYSYDDKGLRVQKSTNGNKSHYT